MCTNGEPPHYRLGEAYEDFRGGLRLYTGIVNEPTLLSGLVRISVLAIVENAVWGGLARRVDSLR
jgi:hypothetical protein